MKKPVTAALFAILAGAAGADSTTVGPLEISDVVARATAATAMTGAGYLTISNTGDAPDVLLSVQADYPRVELHTVDMVDGMAQMRRVERIEIPAGETVTLAPGGFHVMFMGLNGDPFEVGEDIPATLLFETAGEVAVTFTVKDMSHGGMDHGSDG